MAPCPSYARLLPRSGSWWRCRRRSRHASRAAVAARWSGDARRCRVGAIPATMAKCMVVPRPTSLWTASCPPICWTSLDEIVSPSPVPPKRRRRERSACSKASKIRACFSSGNADARVADCKVQDRLVLGPGFAFDFEDDFAPGPVNLMALPTRLTMIWFRRRRVAHDVLGDVRADVTGQLQAPCRGPPRPESSLCRPASRADRTGHTPVPVLPASILEKSRMSSIIASRDSPACCTMLQLLPLLAWTTACRAATRSCR